MTTVLMTTDAVGGVWTYSLELARQLARHSVRVVLAIEGPPPNAAQRAELAKSPVKMSFELALSLEWMDDPWPDVDEAGSRLLELEQRVRPDIVHLNGYSHASLPWAVPTVVVAHSDVLSWWRAVHGTAAPSSWDEYARRVRAGLHAADVVVAPTQAALQSLNREFGHSGGTVIHNGRGREWVGERPKEPLILSAGRVWDAAKNVAALDSVAPMLSWPVYVAGEDGAQPARRSDLAVHPLGVVPFVDLAAWFERASIYASPARYEPFGLATLEAALCGCALVLGDIPSLRELWGDVALFVPPADHEALRATLQRLISEPATCRAMGERARARACRYDADSMAEAYMSVYRSLLSIGVGA